jgi:hypothetical protein
MMRLGSSAARRTWYILCVIAISLAVMAASAHSSSAAPQAQNPIAIITAPADGQQLQGTISVVGSANHPDFNRYELAFGPEPNPNDAWQVFNTGQQPVDNNVLGVWNTNTVADGTYSLRLRVVRKDSNYDEAYVRGLRVVNQQPIATPTSNAPEPTFPPEPTIDVGAAPSSEATPVIVTTVLVEQPPTSVPAAIAPGVTPTSARTNTGSGGLTALIDLGPFMTTCLSGAIIAAFVFGLLGVVQLARVEYKLYLRYRFKKSHHHADSHATPPSTDSQ